MGLTIAVGLALTLLLNAADSLEPAYQNRALHVAKETAAALVLLLVAALLVGRFRRSGRLLDLLALAGVVVLACKSLIFSVLTAVLIETSGGLTTWRTTGVGMLGAAMLAASALAPERILRDRRRAVALTAGVCVAALAILLLLANLFELPAAFTDEPETRSELQHERQTPRCSSQTSERPLCSLSREPRSGAARSTNGTSSSCGSGSGRSSPASRTSTTRCSPPPIRTSCTWVTSSA